MPQQVEKLFITTCDRILIALLQQGECINTDLARFVDIHPVHLSRLLPWLEENGLVFSKRVHKRTLRGGIRRVNRLTRKGREMAEFALRRVEVLKKPLSERDVRELKVWAEKL